MTPNDIIVGKQYKHRDWPQAKYEGILVNGKKELFIDNNRARFVSQDPENWEKGLKFFWARLYPVKSKKKRFG